MQSFFVESRQLARLLEIEAVLAHGHLDVIAELADQIVGVPLDVVEHLADSVPLDHGLEHDLAITSQADVYGVGIAEQVVHVRRESPDTLPAETLPGNTARH